MELLDWGKKAGDAPAAAAPAGKPLAAEGEAATALADALPRLEAAAGTQDPKARLGAIAQVQDAGAAHVAALLAQYLANAAGTYAAREVIWKNLANYQQRLTQALCAAAGAALTLAAAARALGAIRVLAKLHLMHYAAVPGRLWRVAYTIHAGAEKAGFAATPVHAQPDPHVTTTVEQELLRLAMLRISAPDMLAPEQIEVADRVVEQLGADFTLRQPGVADNPFCYEPASEFPPRRAKGRELTETTRYFGPGMGYGSLERIARQMGAARAGDFKAFGKDIAPRVQLATVHHLLAFWREDAPYAPPAHSPATGTLQVVHGYGPLWQYLSQSAGGALSLTEYSPAASQPPEAWELRGAGGSELGAQVPEASRAWAKCGALVGLQMREGERWVGLIRRMHAEPEGGLRADIAVLSRQPRAEPLREVLEQGEDSAFTNASSRQFGLSAVNAVILADGADGAQPANLLLPPDRWKPGRVYELQEKDAPRFLRGTQLVRHGEDFARVTFEWVTPAG
jgi:hypothetical protein